MSPKIDPPARPQHLPIVATITSCIPVEDCERKFRNGTPRLSPKAFKRLAIHEAGHAAVAFYEGVRLQSVSIIADDDTLGRVRHHNVLKGINLEFDRSDGARCRAESVVRVALAGIAAERLWLGQAPGALASDDMAEAVLLISGFTSTNEETGVWLDLLRLQTQQILRNDGVRGWVDALAPVLIERGELTGKEAEAIMISAGRTAP